MALSNLFVLHNDVVASAEVYCTISYIYIVMTSLLKIIEYTRYATYDIRKKFAPTHTHVRPTLDIHLRKGYTKANNHMAINRENMSDESVGLS